MRQLQGRHFEQHPQRGLDPRAAAADQLNVVEQKGDDHHRREDAAEPREKLACNIGGQGSRELHQQPSPGPHAVLAANLGRRKPNRRLPRIRMPSPRMNGKRSVAYIKGITAAERDARSLTPMSSNSKKNATTIANR